MDTFQTLFDRIETIIPYDRDWSNGVGFHPYAVNGPQAPVLKTGEEVKSISPGGRRMIFLGTGSSNLVLYDRYAPTEKKTGFVYNADIVLQDIIRYPENVVLDQESIDFIINELFN